MAEDPFATRLPPAEDPHETVHRPLPSSAEAAHSVPVVEPQIATPRPPHRSLARRLRGGAAIAAGLAGAGLIGYGLGPARSPATSPSVQATSTPAPIPLAVTGLTIRSEVGTLHCPSAVLRIAGVIRTNGSGGTAKLAWVLPTGTTAPQTVEIPAGRTSTDVTLSFALSGRGSSSGDARLHLLAPADVFSAPVKVRYVCP